MRIADRLDDIIAAAADLGTDLGTYRDRLDADPQRLEQIEARRAVLGGLMRRYGEDVSAVLKWAESAQARLDELDVSDEALARLAAERDELGRRAAELAAEVTAQRQVAAEHARFGDHGRARRARDAVGTDRRRGPPASGAGRRR